MMFVIRLTPDQYERITHDLDLIANAGSFKHPCGITLGEASTLAAEVLERLQQEVETPAQQAAERSEAMAEDDEIAPGSGLQLGELRSYGRAEAMGDE